MSANRPRLVLLRGDASIDQATLEALRERCDVVEADDLAAAGRIAAESAGTIMIGHAGRILGAAAGLQRAGKVIESIGEGVGLVHESGEVLWMNSALASRDPETLRRYADGCVEAIRAFQAHPPSEGGAPVWRRTFRSGGTWYEEVVSPVASDAPAPKGADAGESARGSGSPAERKKVDSAVGVLWDITVSRRLQERIEAVEAAGEELLRLDPAVVCKMNMAERLKAMERSVIHGVQEVLGFESFEVRLLDRRTGKLELVIAVGIQPLRIGESLFATPTDNGISGHVATCGQSYICADVTVDPLYREGLESARSSLTVPLLLQERVAGVLNVESPDRDRFDEEDRLLAELYGRYLAQTLNIFELLLAERCATSEQLAASITSELKHPLDEIGAQVTALRERLRDDADGAQRLDQIVEAVAIVRARIEACTAGPRSLIGAEEDVATAETDPLLVDRRVLVADDEPLIRQTILAVLAKRGADVTVCRDGGGAIEQMRRAAAEGRPFDLVISDVRMPDRNGYEVFRAAKEIAASTPVILMTGFGYDPHHSIVRSSQEGLHCFLFKPFQVSQLMDEVRKAVRPAAERSPNSTPERNGPGTR